MTEACRDVAIRLAEPLSGSAPVTRRWVLVEHAGPWGRDALTGGSFSADTADILDRLLTASDVRLQLVRRHGEGRRGLGSVVMMASSASDNLWVRRFHIATPDDLLKLPLAQWDDPGGPAEGDPVDAPVVLVCTHGRRDACCARFGRPLARALASLKDVDAWETTHTGGHRFAPNLVVLPQGYLYGRVALGDAQRLVAGHLGGRVDLDHLRGRSSCGPFEQVAELEVRRRTGLDGHDEVVTVDTQREGRTATVVVRAADEYHLVRVERRTGGVPRAVSCGAPETDPGAIVVVAVEAATPACPRDAVPERRSGSSPTSARPEADSSAVPTTTDRRGRHASPRHPT